MVLMLWAHCAVVAPMPCSLHFTQVELLWVEAAMLGRRLTTRHTLLAALSTYVPGGKGASVRSNRSAMSWTKKAAQGRAQEEPVTPRVSLLSYARCRRRVCE